MTVPSMRDLINLYESISRDAEKNAAIDYFKGSDISQKERLNRQSPVENGGKANNPNSSAAIGKDGANKASENFSDGDKLRKIDQLKKSVEALQRLSHKKDLGLSEDKEDFEKIIGNMNKAIDELSDSLVDIV